MMIKAKKLLSILLVVMLVFSSTVTAFADEDAEADKEDQKKQEEQLKAKKEAEKKAAQEKAKQEAEKKAAEEKAKQEAEKKAAEEKAAQEKAKQEAEAKKKAEAEAAEKAAEDKASESKEDQGGDQTKEAPAEEASADSAKTREKTSENGTEKTQKEQKAEKQDSTKKSKLKLQSEELSNGTYKPEATFTGGSGRVTYTCEKVIIKDGKATAVFNVDTDNVTHVYLGKLSSREENKSLYDPKTGKIGDDVYTFVDRHVSVPVTLGETVDFSGRTNAMSSANRWIGYTYTLKIEDESQKISDDTTIPENGESKPEETEEDDSKEEEKEDSKSKKKTLKDGTYKVKATTCRVMFYLYPKEKNPAQVILVKKNGKMTATITLTGAGYDYVYMGTPKQAKKAGKKNWIKYKKVNGYYTFTIPVSKLDKKLPITPHSRKYESDGDPSTDPWRPDKWIKFYSSGAKKVKDGTSIKTKKRTTPVRRSDSTTGKTYKDDSNAGTSAVNNSTSLKDGTYKPDRSHWSGGSGRLAYIHCNKVVVKGGKAFATIEFSSTKYDSLRANGRTYSKQGGGNSKFTIPVKLNANNTIVGRTTAMSQPHWIKYTLFIYIKGAGGSNGKTAEGDDGHLTSTKKLSEDAPDLLGLEFKEKVETKYAKYFKIFKYEQGITLISIDQSSKTALYKEESKKKDKNSKSESSEEEAVEYDEDGKPIAKSLNEVTEELYQNNIVNYLVVPEKAELPAGLEKDCVIINQPVEKSYIASDPLLKKLVEMGVLDKISDISMAEEDVKDKEVLGAIKDEKLTALGDTEKPDYAALIKSKADIAIFPDTVLPEIVKDDDEAAKAESDEKKDKLATMQSRFAALGVPMLVDRAADEKTNYGEAEWIKVFGVIYGTEDKADAMFNEYIKNNEEKKIA